MRFLLRIPLRTILFRLVVILGFGGITFPAQAQAPTEIRVNLGGYPTHMPKKALILSRVALDAPTLLLKNESGQLIREYQGTPEAQAW